MQNGAKWRIAEDGGPASHASRQPSQPAASNAAQAKRSSSAVYNGQQTVADAMDKDAEVSEGPVDKKQRLAVLLGGLLTLHEPGHASIPVGMELAFLCAVGRTEDSQPVQVSVELGKQ